MSNEVKGAVAPVATEQQEQTPVVEQQKAQQPDPAQERFAQLARKEKALRSQARQLQEQQRAIQEQQAKAQSSLTERLKSDPLSVLAEAGLTHDQIAEALLNSRPDDIELRRIKAELQSIKNSQQEQFTKIQDAQKAAYEQAVKQVSREVKMLVDGNEAYETIQSAKAHEAVVELIKQTYDEDGVLLSAEEAADMVEEYLLDEALTMAKLKKVQSKLAPPVAADSGTEVPQGQKPQIQTKTLTNTIVSSSKPLSNKDRRARAIAAFKGELK
jgi:hypothetical protein